MTREEIESTYEYHEAGAEMEYYGDIFKSGKEVNIDDIPDAFEAGAYWAQKFMIERACEWLRENAHIHVSHFTHELDVNGMIEDFKQAMEE